MAVPATAPSRARYLSETQNFYQINQDSDKKGILRQIFERILAPLYGPQDKALDQIAQGKDRTCFLLYEKETPMGVIAFKLIPSDEFSSYKIQNSIEIKSLFVVNSESNSGRGLGSVLLHKLVDEVQKLSLKPDSFHVTVSASKGESLNFFMGKGFRIRHTWEGKYVPNMLEYLLSCPAKSLDPDDVAPAQIHRIIPVQPQQIAVAQPSFAFHPHALFRIDNAHWGDIHVLMPLSDGTFITGSKDNSMSKWNAKGERIRVVSEVPLTESDEKDWITAACPINKEYWVSGERNGSVTLWTTAGESIKSLKPKMPKLEHVSHQNNKRRVNCLSSNSNPQKPGFFIGFPTMFDEFNVIEGRTSSSTTVHSNDWVYCIHPLTSSSILTVTAGTLELWEKPQKEWKRTKKLLQETQKVRGQRPYISCLTPLQSSPQHFGLGIFGGSVKVYDLEQEAVIKDWKEHKEKIWTLENVSPQLFATGGEDRSIKFWDIRNQKSVRTIPDHIGEVTALMKLSDHLIVAGTCPTQTVRTNEGGAQLLFYEMRK
jgi:WD40 repeat protein